MVSKHLPHYKYDERPWGNFRQFTENQPSTVKILFVRAHEEDSLQTHARREEFWHILSGSGTVMVGDVELEAHAGSEFFIPAGVQHRLRGGPEGLRLLEIAFGDFDENDEVRIDDDYGRT